MKFYEFITEKGNSGYLPEDYVENEVMKSAEILAKHVDKVELSEFMARLQIIMGLFREGDTLGERMHFCLLATILTVEHLQSSQEIIRDLMRIPVPVIPDRGESTSTSQNT